MKEFYIIEDNYAIIELSSNIYPTISVQKAIANFMDLTYIKLEEKENKIILKLKIKDNKENLEQIIGEFYNELLRESLWYNISKETKNLRELIVGRALYTTCIEMDKELTEKQEILESTKDNDDFNEEEDFPLDEIVINWFEKYDDNKWLIIFKVLLLLY